MAQWERHRLQVTCYPSLLAPHPTTSETVPTSAPSGLKGSASEVKSARTGLSRATTDSFLPDSKITTVNEFFGLLVHLASIENKMGKIASTH